MWSKILRITNFVLCIIAGILFAITIGQMLFNMPDIFTDGYLRQRILSDVNAAGSIFWVMAWWWQTGTINRLKGEVKDKTLMW